MLEYEGEGESHKLKDYPLKSTRLWLKYTFDTYRHNAILIINRLTTYIYTNSYHPFNIQCLEYFQMPFLIPKRLAYFNASNS